MGRLFVCLPICLLMAPNYYCPPLRDTFITERVQLGSDQGKLVLPDAKADPQGFFDFCLKRRVRLDTYKALGDDPIVFLEFCLKHYDRTVKDYSLLFQKQEYLGGALKPVEIVQVYFRAKPYSVFMGWREGARLTDCSLYVEGENKDSKGKSQVLARSKQLKTVIPNDPQGFFAKQSSRYPINTFSLRQVMEMVLDPWKEAHAEKTLHVQYEGLHVLPQAGHRICHKLHRTQFAHPDPPDGVEEATIYIDRDTLLQVGTIVEGAMGKDGKRILLGEYFFRDINLHPPFAPDQFERSAVERW
jgi:hypothetical protein